MKPMYEITITKTVTETQITGKRWEVICKRLVTAKDVESSVYASDRVLRDKALAGQIVLMDEYGYTPEVEKQVEVKREIYKQVVEDLDIVTVINAINE